MIWERFELLLTGTNDWHLVSKRFQPEEMNLMGRCIYSIRDLRTIRGLLADSAAKCFPVEVLLRILESQSMILYNVQSSKYKSKAQGYCHADKKYSQADPRR